MLRNLTLKQTSGIFVALLLLTGVALEIGIRVAHVYIEEIQKTWAAFETERSEKARLETFLLASLGYGGMIHNFKNFVLRNDSKYSDQAKEGLGAARAIVAQYSALGISGAESVALEDIDATLEAYQEALQISAARARSGSSAAEIDATVKVDDRLALRALATLHKANVAKRSDDTDFSSKSALASRLRAILGYGGFIHAFKNYVLRQETSYLVRARETLGELDTIIDQWRKIGVTSGERLALDDLDQTFKQYAARFAEVEKLTAEGKPIGEIDSVVKVNDALALRGLAILDREIAYQIGKQAAEVGENFRVVFQLELILTWIVRGFIGLLVVLAIGLMYRLIIGPIKSIAGAMTQLAGGNFGVYVPGSDMGNEIGQMARAFGIFKDTAIKHKEAEDRLAESNEELSQQVLELRDLRDRSDQQAAKALSLAENLTVARDEAERATRRAEADELRIRSILNTVNDAIITIDMDGLIESFNRAAETIFGYKQDEVLGRNVSMLMPEPQRSDHNQHLRAYNVGGPARVLGQTVEQVAQLRDGTVFPIEVSVNAMLISGETKFTGVIRDITERRKAEEEIRRLALTDPLTGLANRNQFNQKFDHALTLARRREDVVGLMMLDLDRFKPVNDTYGHPVGDALLKWVAERLREISRDTDTVARLGGDEFAIIVVDPENRDALGMLAERVVEALSAETSILGHHLQIGTSIGIALFPDHGETPEDLMGRADRALYAAKEAGRNTFRYFEQAVADESGDPS